jgi:hypothetical protein
MIYTGMIFGVARKPSLQSDGFRKPVEFNEKPEK